MEVLKDWAWKWCLSHARHDPVKLSQGRVRSPVQKRTQLARDFHQTLYSLQNPPWISCCALESSPASRVPHWEVGREWVPKRVRKLQFSQPLSASTQYLKRSIIPWGAFGVVGLNCFIWIHSQPHLLPTRRSVTDHGSRLSQKENEWHDSPSKYYPRINLIRRVAVPLLGTVLNGNMGQC